jgi:hypothetical protein
VRRAVECGGAWLFERAVDKKLIHELKLLAGVSMRGARCVNRTREGRLDGAKREFTPRVVTACSALCFIVETRRL